MGPAMRMDFGILSNDSLSNAASFQKDVSRASGQQEIHPLMLWRQGPGDPDGESF